MRALIFALGLKWSCRFERLQGAPKLPCYKGLSTFDWGWLMQSALDEVRRFTDSELVCRLEGLVKADRALTAKLLVHLDEVEVRGLHLARSYSSMFDYCRSGLGMSEAEAYLWILASRVGRRFPLVLERLAAGALHLTAIKLLEPHLTLANHVQLLDRVRGMTKREIEVVVADLAPKPDVPARVRKLPVPHGLLVGPGTLQSSASQVGALPLLAAGSRSKVAQPLAAQEAPSEPSATFALQSPRPRATSTPLGEGRFELKVTLGQAAQTALDQLVELFRHQNPSGDLKVIVERALFELLETKMKQRFGHKGAAGPRAKTEPSARKTNVATAASGERSPQSRHIPLAVRREVHARDAGQCTFVDRDGRRCTERGFMEVHHHNTTFARGGEATVENLRLTCAAHNRFLAEQDYGRAFVQDKLRQAKARKAKRRALVPDTVTSTL